VFLYIVFLIVNNKAILHYWSGNFTWLDCIYLKNEYYLYLLSKDSKFYTL